MDKIEWLKRSLIQHGKHNDRIYLMKLERDDVPGIIGELMFLGVVNQYGKVFAKVPAEQAEVFQHNGYAEEARIPGYLQGEEDMCLMSLFLKPERAECDHLEDIKSSLSRAMDSEVPPLPPLPDHYRLRECRAEDLHAMAQLYQKVFPTYPFPIQEAGYLRQAMEEDVRFFGVWKDDQLVALASAECAPEALTAEMTDFATDPAERGKGLASHLLLLMEDRLKESGYKTAYTIARALSPSMNRVFFCAGYDFTGTLINNTQIMDRMESMNVWGKYL